MRNDLKTTMTLFLTAAALSAAATGTTKKLPGEEAAPAAETQDAGPALHGAWTTAVEPKELGPAVERGLAWLVQHQLANGSFGQGEEAPGTGASSPWVDQGNVADTCMAALALVRAGSTPAEGRHAAVLARAIDSICTQVEAHAEDQSLWITSVRGTRVQSKIGTYIDTFLASMVLGEVQGRMPSAEGNARVKAALAIVLDKIERNQAANGTWENQGWAPVLAQSMAGKGLNRARQLGFDVSLAALERADDFATGRPEASPGSAGVALYDSAASLGALQESVNTSVKRQQELEAELDTTVDEKERDEIENELEKIADVRAEGQKQKDDVIRRLDDERFVAGFGSNGGEEFLSYMNIAESLVVKGGDEWSAGTPG